MLNFSKKDKGEVDINLDKKIEAILFFKAEEVSLSFLVKTLGEKKKKILEGIEKLKERLEDTALILIENNDRFLLAVKADFSDLIEQIKEKEELSELSQAAMETLAIILYKNKVSRAELDEIRGINSSHILRNLLIRGLIEKKNEDSTIKYIPTLELLSFLGVESVEKLPSFSEVRKKIDEIQNKIDEIEKSENIQNNKEIE